MRIAQKRLQFSEERISRLTHYLFRYPAKFHPPVARRLLQSFTRDGDTILDPFCGSGTLAVEAAVLGRHSIGVDIDPVAVFVSRVKTKRLNLPALEQTSQILYARLETLQRRNSEYVRRQHDDITYTTVRRVANSEGLWIPEIPSISHWFRNYVLIDLARIVAAIESLEAPTSHIDFFLLCFASIIRNSSNADPIPVSGLEVTIHMKRKDEAGRVINPFELFKKSVNKNIRAIREFCEVAPATASARFYHADATELSRVLKSPIDAVITSPPYCSAVDYYRRHTLEMYWLGLTLDRRDRLALLQKYIGRSQVTKNHEFVRDGEMLTPTVRKWEGRIRRDSSARADAFKHYTVAMQRVLGHLSKLLKKDAPAVFVLGKSKWGSHEIPTNRLFEEMAQDSFEVRERLFYPIKNRYMSYERHNGADINKEYVLVLMRK
jgi:tRNA G10  N-methylase Trm11